MFSTTQATPAGTYICPINILFKFLESARIMNIKKLVLKFPIMLMLLLVNGAYADTVAPDVMVKNTANEVLEILKSNKDIENGDMNQIGKLVEEKIATKFDFNLMSRMVMGRNWNTASKEQQDQFIVEFRSLLVRTYSSALSKYRNQTIEYKPLRAKPGDTEVKVKTQIIKPDGPAIPLDYSLAKIEDTWKVYDVIIDGLSLVAIYRGQFAEEVKKNGINSLIQKLAEKNKRPPQSVNSSMTGQGFYKHDLITARFDYLKGRFPKTKNISLHCIFQKPLLRRVSFSVPTAPKGVKLGTDARLSV